MKKTKYLLSTVLASTVLIGMASFHAADAQEYVSKAQAKTLYQAALQGVQGKEMVVKHVAFPAKYVGGKHMHPGPVFVYVL